MLAKRLKRLKAEGFVEGMPIVSGRYGMNTG